MYLLFLYCLHEESYISKLRGREQRDPGTQHPNRDLEIIALDSTQTAQSWLYWKHPGTTKGDAIAQ